MKIKKANVLAALTAAFVAVGSLSAGASAATLADGSYTGTGLVQKFTYNVTVNATVSGGKIVSVAYPEDLTISSQHSVYAESAIEGVSEQIKSKGGISSVTEIDAVSKATLSTNAIKQALADILGEEFDLSKANEGLLGGKEGETGGSIEDSMKKASNFLKLPTNDAGEVDLSQVDTTGKSEAWMTLYNLYLQAAEMKNDSTASEADQTALVSAIDQAITAVKAESGDTGHPSGGKTQSGDPAALNALIEKAKALTESDYTAETFKVVKDELAEAEELLSAPKIPSQETLDGQAADLQAAIDALVKVSAEPSTQAPAKPTTSAKKDTGKAAGSKKAPTIKAKNVTKTYKKSALKKKAKTFKLKASVNSSAKLTFKKTSGSKKITVSSKGNVKVAKNTKKGTYKIKVKVSAKAKGAYKAGSKTITLKIKVK